MPQTPRPVAPEVIAPMQGQRTTPKDGRKLAKTPYPGIFKRGSRYVVVWYHDGGQHKSFHATLAEAKEAQGIRRQPGRSRPASQRRFPDYAAEWLNFYDGRSAGGLAPSTRRAYERDMKQRICPFFRRYRLAEIGPPEIRRFIGELEKEGLAPTSIKKILAPLKALFATAVDELAVTFNPTLGVRVKGGGASVACQAHKAIPASDLRALLRALPEREQLLCMVLAETGMRISEALGLDWTDVYLGRRDQIRISQQYYRGELRKLKTEKSLRCLPISKSLAKRLRRARAKTNGEGAVFVSRQGTRLSDRNVRRTFAKACTRAQIAGVPFHRLRHSFASRLYDDHKDIRKVSEWLGHAEPTFTLRTYIHEVEPVLGDAPSWNLAA